MKYIKENLDETVFYILNIIYFSIRIVQTFNNKEVTTFQCIVDLLMFVTWLYILSIDIKKHIKNRTNKKEKQ